MSDLLLEQSSQRSNVRDIYQYNPAVKNLFQVEVYPGKGDLTDESITSYGKLHIQSIKFAGAKLLLTRHNVTKLFALDKYQRSDEVTLVWRENSLYRVRGLHIEWLRNFYREADDRFVSYENADKAEAHLTKMFRILLPNKHSLILKGVMPTSIPELDLNWADSSVTQYTLTYKVTEWEWV